MSEANQILHNMSELQKYIVLLINSNNSEPVKGKTWFQKELFLIAKNIPELAEEASFEADMYGPYSENAEEQLEELEMDEVIRKEKNKLFISRLGKEVANEIEKKIPKEKLEIISDFKSLLNNLNDKEVLTLVYCTFPNMTEESLVREDIEKNRREIAIKLYEKDKVSLQRAAEIGGIPLEKFVHRVER